MRQSRPHAVTIFAPVLHLYSLDQSLYIHLTNPCDCNSALSARNRRERSVAVIGFSNFGGRPAPRDRLRFAPSMQGGCVILGPKIDCLAFSTTSLSRLGRSRSNFPILDSTSNLCSCQLQCAALHILHKGGFRFSPFIRLPRLHQRPALPTHPATSLDKPRPLLVQS
jgi:hypothetical protein